MNVSIIITNYNYENYIKQCIESCLSQTYDKIEVIVVDDGSTDNSRAIIKSFKNKIKFISKKNGGMIDASNSGFVHANGDIVIFLDADDFIFDNAVEKIVSNWSSNLSKIHFRLQKIDKIGNQIGTFPKNELKLDEGEVWKKILKSGTYTNVPTSGNAYSKSVLDKIFPILDASINNSNSYFDIIPTDAYLKMRVPFYGDVFAIQDPIAAYRIHDKNNGANSSPFFNPKKRKRVLNLARLNTIFIDKISTKKKFKWDSDILFKKNKMLMLRIISYRNDGNDHLWANDSKFILLKIAIKNFFNSNGLNYLKKCYKLIFNISLIYLSKSIAFLLLKNFKSKRHNQ